MKKSEFYVLRNAVHLQEFAERHPLGSATLCSVMTLSKTIPILSIFAFICLSF